MKRTLKLVLLLLLISNIANAQKTGSFDENITFMNEQRTLSFFVPADYDSTVKYRLMVALHGMGDNSKNMRNVLSNSAGGFTTYIPNTIMVCPDGGNDPYRSFNIPEGDEEIIQEAIDYAAAHYNIDESAIILEGFSLGGRTALQYGLEHPEKFKGLLLHTPAVQGVKDAIVGGGMGPFNYNNAPKIPIYITHGADDVLYTAPIDTAYEKLILNNGIVRFYRFAGMGHQPPSFQRTANFLGFLDKSAFAEHDLDIVRVTTPPRSCNAQVPATVLVRNMGKNNISAINLDYKVNANTLSHNWSGTLAPFQHVFIALPTLNATAGNNTLQVEVKTLNGSVNDTVTENNTKSTTFNFANTSVKLPLSEGFEDEVFPPAGWLLNRSGDYILPWTRDTDTKKDGVASIFTLNTILIFDNAGRREEILSPVLDLTSAGNPSLAFDVAYNYIRYTPPYFTQEVDFADTLEVLISTDCGTNFTSLYKKGGRDLATFANPLLNPLNLNAIDFSPADSNWRRERVDLANYGSSANAVVKFSFISAMGGLISLDNISFGSPTAIKENKVGDKNYKLFPNPATDKVNVVVNNNEKLQKINVLDVAGRNVMTVVNENTFNTEMSVNTSTLKDGFYFFEIVIEKGISTSKVLIKR